MWVDERNLGFGGASSRSILTGPWKRRGEGGKEGGREGGREDAPLRSSSCQ